MPEGLSKLARIIQNPKEGGSMSAAMVQAEARAADRLRDGGSQPTSPLHELVVQPIPIVVAKALLEREHYLHSLPGGTRLAFGVFLSGRLLGAVTLGAGPYLAHRLVQGASPDDCLTLTRLWLSDELPHNSESRVLGILLRALKKHTPLKFLVTYADPSHGHLGTIYQATGWVYTGTSQATPLYDLGSGAARHSRSVAHAFGTRSMRHFTACGLKVRQVPQAAKHRYVYFLDRSWSSRLKTSLPYPRKNLTITNK